MTWNFSITPLQLSVYTAILSWDGESHGLQAFLLRGIWLWQEQPIPKAQLCLENWLYYPRLWQRANTPPVYHSFTIKRSFLLGVWVTKQSTFSQEWACTSKMTGRIALRVQRRLSWFHSRQPQSGKPCSVWHGDVSPDHRSSLAWRRRLVTYFSSGILANNSCREGFFGMWASSSVGLALGYISMV